MTINSITLETYEAKQTFLKKIRKEVTNKFEETLSNRSDNFIVEWDDVEKAVKVSFFDLSTSIPVLSKDSTDNAILRLERQEEPMEILISYNNGEIVTNHLMDPKPIDFNGYVDNYVLPILERQCDLEKAI